MQANFFNQHSSDSVSPSNVAGIVSFCRDKMPNIICILPLLSFNVGNNCAIWKSED